MLRNVLFVQIFLHKNTAARKNQKMRDNSCLLARSELVFRHVDQRIYYTKYDKFFVMKRTVLARVVEHDVLSCEFEQHGIVEELVDRNIFRETLPPPAKRRQVLILILTTQ